MSEQRSGGAGGGRGRPRPSKAAFTPPPAKERPEESPKQSARPPGRQPAPSVLFQPPRPAPDEPPTAPARSRPPEQRVDPDRQPDPAPAEPAPAETPAAKKAAPESAPAKTPPAKKATPAKKASPAKKAAAPAKRAAKKATSEPAPTKVAKKVAPKAAAPQKAVETAVALVSEPVARRTPASVEERPAITPRLLDRPGHAPELLAIAAVRVLGPQARDWAAQTLATYPAATPDGLARLAARRFVRAAGAGGVVSGVFGLLAPVTELSAAAWAQASLVLHVAAAYGQDPTDAERAVDLLVLTGVHPGPEMARAALAEATDAAADSDGQPAWRAAEATWRIVASLTGQIRGWAAVRVVARRLPGMVPLVAGAGNAAAAERLAHRATAHYRSQLQWSRSSV